MAYTRKTRDEWRLMINYGSGHGWEFETAESTYKDIRQRKKEYAENCPEYPTRIVCKRVAI